MIIKQHSNKNQYLLTEQGYWCRDFTHNVYPQDINSLTSESDLHIFAKNETSIKSMNIASIDREFIRTTNAVIISDGYKFEENKDLLKKLPKNVTVIGVNKTLNKDIRMDYFVINNPYEECMSYFSTAYFPKCIVSTRSNPNFAKKYKAMRGVVYKYVPTKDKHYGGTMEANYYIDDYRNPICAAIGLAYRWGVKKLLLFCCDNAFEDERPGSTKLQNGLHTYPQHLIAHGFINGCLYWMKQQDVKIGNYSNGPEYKDVPYISKDEVKGFFDA